MNIYINHLCNPRTKLNGITERVKKVAASTALERRCSNGNKSSKAIGFKENTHERCHAGNSECVKEVCKKQWGKQNSPEV